MIWTSQEYIGNTGGGGAGKQREGGTCQLANQGGGERWWKDKDKEKDKEDKDRAFKDKEDKNKKDKK